MIILNNSPIRFYEKIKPNTKSHTKKEKPLMKQKGFHLFLMLVPFIILVFLLNYLPLYHWRAVFYNYKPGLALTSDRFVGFDNFINLIGNKFQMERLFQVLANTFALSGLSMLTLPLAMFFAIFLSEIRCSPFKKVVQTLTTIPNFISWVLVYSVASSAFATNDGFVNRLLVQMGVIDQGISFLSSSNHVWIVQIAWYTWKSLGWSAIMYFAAMSNIDQELYGAAEVDGAGRFARIWHITIPSLIPTLFVMLVLNIANFVNYGFEQPFVFQNVMNQRYIETLDLFVYNQGIAGRNQAAAIIIGILKTFVSLVLVFSANGVSKLVRKESVF